MFIKIKEQLIELFEEEPRCTNRERVHDSNGNYIALMRSICGNPPRLSRCQERRRTEKGDRITPTARA